MGREQKDELLNKVCLGDGKVPIDMGGYFELVSGTRMASHEPVWLTPAREEGLFRRAQATPDTFVPPKGHLYCSGCGEWRPTHYFDRDASRKGRGYSYECKACENPKDAERKRQFRRRQAEAEGRAVRPYRYRDKAVGE